MSQLEANRLARLQSWLADLDQLLAEPTRAQDQEAIEAATFMHSECRRFIAEAEAQIEKGE